jgi:hypothetical protein
MNFEMEVVERAVLPGIPDVILAGPVHFGTCGIGDRLRLTGEIESFDVSCIGIELVNWGSERTGWLSIRVSDVDLADVGSITRVSSAA